MPTGSTFSAWISACRSALQANRRPWYRRIGTPTVPAVMEFDDTYLGERAEYEHLMAQGIVVWGFVIQANQGLYEPGDVQDARWCDVVHPCKVRLDDRPGLLADVADALRATKYTWPEHDELRGTSLLLTAEYARCFHHSVPDIIESKHCLHVSSVLAHRWRLPGASLGNRLVPVIIERQVCSRIAVLPSSLWPSDFKQQWRTLTVFPGSTGEAKRRLEAIRMPRIDQDFEEPE